jgi:hypothetical protein
MRTQKQPNSVSLSATATIPELQQSKTAVLNTLASQHSRRSYEYAIERFIAWYCSEPRLTFNRSVVVKYRSFLERLSLSAATINLPLSAIRRLADESAESGWLSPEHAIGIRRVKGVKRLGRKMGIWLTRNQAQEPGSPDSDKVRRTRKSSPVCTGANDPIIPSAWPQLQWGNYQSSAHHRSPIFMRFLPSAQQGGYASLVFELTEHVKPGKTGNQNDVYSTARRKLQTVICLDSCHFYLQLAPHRLDSLSQFLLFRSASWAPYRKRRLTALRDFRLVFGLVRDPTPSDVAERRWRNSSSLTSLEFRPTIPTEREEEGFPWPPSDPLQIRSSAGFSAATESKVE